MLLGLAVTPICYCQLGHADDSSVSGNSVVNDDCNLDSLDRTRSLDFKGTSIEKNCDAAADLIFSFWPSQLVGLWEGLPISRISLDFSEALCPLQARCKAMLPIDFQLHRPESAARQTKVSDESYVITLGNICSALNHRLAAETQQVICGVRLRILHRLMYCRT